MKKAIEAVLAAPWAITPEYLDVIASIAEREHEFAGNLQALEAKLGRPLGNTMTATVRDGVAIIPVEGPLFKRAGFFAQMSGATDYATIAKDMTAALADPAIKGILLHIDSPGGEVSGTSQLAQMIAAADKPVWSYVGGTLASAAYWIASATDRIVTDDTAIIGSIGVQSGYSVKDPKAGEKSYRFVSSQSPNKNAGPDTEAGAAQIQGRVDDLAQVFVDAVAANRATTSENVLQSYGQGSVFVAAEAMKRGMIDSIGTFEGTLSLMKQELDSMDYSKLTVASLTEHRADLVAAITASGAAGVEKVDAEALRAEGATAERQRIENIEALAMPGTESLIAKFKADGTKPEAAAIEILKAARAGALAAPVSNGAQHLAALKQTEAALAPPAASSGDDAKMTDEQAASAAIALARKAGIEA